MRVHVLVLCDQPDGLARTSGDLDAQTLGYSDFAVTYLAAALDDAGSTRLDDLVSRRPNLARAQVEGDNWSVAVLQVAEQTSASTVLVVKVGDRLFPEALDRLAGLAEQGHDVVVGRRAGQPVWGSAGSRGPVAAVLASGSTAKAAAGTVEAQSSVDGWLTGWHDALLDAASGATALQDYPVLAPTAGTASDTLPAEEVTARWEGAALVLDASLPASAAGLEPTFVARGPGGIEFTLETEAQTDGASTRITGRLDVSTAALGRPLDDGDWTLGVEASAPGAGAWSALPRTTVPSALIGGRPVVATLRADNLQLQVGAVRRRYFRANPDDAVITESVAGVELLLPVEGLHVADTDAVHGLLLLGGLKIPAVLRAADGGTTLQAWLSGLAGKYPMSVKFGHIQPVPLGMTLVIDGVGAMSLVAARPPAAQDAAVPTEGAAGKVLGRVRRAVPEPVVAGLRKVPALQRWYANRAG